MSKLPWQLKLGHFFLALIPAAILGLGVATVLYGFLPLAIAAPLAIAFGALVSLITFGLYYWFHQRQFSKKLSAIATHTKIKRWAKLFIHFLALTTAALSLSVLSLIVLPGWAFILSGISTGLIYYGIKKLVDRYEAGIVKKAESESPSQPKQEDVLSETIDQELLSRYDTYKVILTREKICRAIMALAYGAAIGLGVAAVLYTATGVATNVLPVMTILVASNPVFLGLAIGLSIVAGLWFSYIGYTERITRLKNEVNKFNGLVPEERESWLMKLHAPEWVDKSYREMVKFFSGNGGVIIIINVLCVIANPIFGWGIALIIGAVLSGGAVIANQVAKQVKAQREEIMKDPGYESILEHAKEGGENIARQGERAALLLHKGEVVKDDSTTQVKAFFKNWEGGKARKKTGEKKDNGQGKAELPKAVE